MNTFTQSKRNEKWHTIRKRVVDDRRRDLSILPCTIKFSEPSVRDELQSGSKVDLPQPEATTFILRVCDRLSPFHVYLTRNRVRGNGTSNSVRPRDPEYEFEAECTRLDPRCWALCGNQIKSTLSPGTWRASFYTRWRVPILRVPLPRLLSHFPACPRREATSNVYPSRATLRTLRPVNPRTTRLFSYQFIFPFIVRLRKNRRAQAERIIRKREWKRLYALVDCSPLGRTRPRKEGLKRARENEEIKYRRKMPRGPRRTRYFFSPCISSPSSASR